MPTFRNYDDANERVKKLYAEQRKKQTVSYILRMQQKFRKPIGRELNFDEIFSLLDQFVDNSDPDLALPNSHHALQAAEAARAAGAADWMILTALIHDFGKNMCSDTRK